MIEMTERSSHLINTVQVKFKRYLLDKIRWNNRLIAITGSRGCGKTTMLLQYAKELNLSEKEVLYISLDDMMLRNMSLMNTASRFYKNGGKLLIFDEVHKYPSWSVELKNIYDTYKELKVIFTGSSLLEIYKGEADLSRRAIAYSLHNLSLREYIELKEGITFPVFTLDEVLNNNRELAELVNSKIRPLKYFNEYLKEGAFPFFVEDEETYLWKLENTINTAIETDLPALISIDYSTIVKIKLLLGIIAESVPFIPNILKLSERIGTKRDTLIRHLHLLEKAGLILLLNSPARGIGKLTKPDKIYLHNTNLLFALAGDTVNKGTLRETFFINQLAQSHQLHFIEKGDFLLDKKYVIEIGGLNKDSSQIKNTSKAYIAMDDIEFGNKNNIPLWMFGFLY
jgi:uncharacterized protein